MLRRPPRSTLFPTRRSSDLAHAIAGTAVLTSASATSAAADDSHRQNGHALSLNRLTEQDRKSTRLNSSHSQISYAVFCLKKKKKCTTTTPTSRITAHIHLTY